MCVFYWQVICVADEYVMLVKGAETAVLDQLASGPRDVTLDHVNQYAEVCRLVCPYWTNKTRKGDRNDHMQTKLKTNKFKTTIC